MFRKFKTINDAFQYVRAFTMLVIVACSGLSAFIIWRSFMLAQTSKSTVYVLANGRVLEAFASDRKTNIVVEAKDHIRSFHEAFFSLDPDDKLIEANLTRALYLADISAKRQYDNLKESGYFSNVIAGNISQEISVDSISVESNSYPHYFKCFAVQKIIRATNIVTRSLVTQGYLRNVSRSENNPHGFLIERWQTLENKDIKQENR
jgi:conjugative transposon TraK protein